MKKLPPVLGGRIPQGEHQEGRDLTVYDITAEVLKNVGALGLDYLVAIGGDDTLSYAAGLDREGVKVIAVPKTMDNDVRNTEYCIGFSTAITRAMDAIDRQRTTVGSHERIGMFRVFGRDAGYTALYTAYVRASAAHSGIQVRLEEHDWLLLQDKKDNPSNYSIVVLSEGAEWEGYKVREYGEADAFGHRKKANVGEDLSDEIKKASGQETVVSDLTYELRSGSPDFVDKLVASTFASMAMDALARARRLDDGHQQGQLRHGADSRSQTGTAPRGHGQHV